MNEQALKPIIAEKAKENQANHTEQGYQKSDKAVHTTKELATIAGVSHDTRGSGMAPEGDREEMHFLDIETVGEGLSGVSQKCSKNSLII